MATQSSALVTTPRRALLLGSLLSVALLVGCGSSGSGASTTAATAAANTSTCTTAAPADTTAQPTTAVPPTTTALGPSGAEARNTGTFTFDVVCQKFGNCACDAALAEPLTVTISFTTAGAVFTNDEGTITYPPDGSGSYRLVVDADKEKVATLTFSDTGFVFDMTIAGAPCSLQTYTRR
ncbi:MAG: hypothetical protein WCC60_07660 [Ilumatobacteraceae bacterium]